SKRQLAGSSRLMCIRRYVVSPKRGSRLWLRTTTRRSLENQRSYTLSIARSLPIAPAGMVIVVRVPSAVTPSIFGCPRDSVLLVGGPSGLPDEIPNASEPWSRNVRKNGPLLCSVPAIGFRGIGARLSGGVVSVGNGRVRCRIAIRRCGSSSYDVPDAGSLI